MFVLKQFLKGLILPPTSWIIALLVVLIFWQRRWARKLLFATVVLIAVIYSGQANGPLRRPLESRYPPLLDPRGAEPYDAIVVLMSSTIPATGLIPFPSLDEYMFRRLDEGGGVCGWGGRAVVVCGGDVGRGGPPRNENQIAIDYLIRWG